MANGITEQDVWRAADELLLEGARPTIERVRQKIGRSSPNTVQPYLDTWFKGLGARVKDPKAFSAPVSVPDPIAQAAEHFWAVASAEARAVVLGEHEAERQQLDAERRSLEEARRELANRETTFTTRLEATATSLALTTTQLEEARRREAVGQMSITVLNQRNEELTAALSNLHRQLDQVRAESDIVVQRGFYPDHRNS